MFISRSLFNWLGFCFITYQFYSIQFNLINKQYLSLLLQNASSSLTSAAGVGSRTRLSTAITMWRVQLLREPSLLLRTESDVTTYAQPSRLIAYNNTGSSGKHFKLSFSSILHVLNRCYYF